MTPAIRSDRPSTGTIDANGRVFAVTCLLVVILGLTACSSPGAMKSMTGPERIANPDGFDVRSVEPGTGTEVTLNLPDTVASGQELRIPVMIRIGDEPDLWDHATLQIETDGPFIATVDIDTAALEAGNSVQGMLTIRPPTATSDMPTAGGVSLTLRLRNGQETTTVRRVEFGILADEQTTWLGYVTPDLLRLDRLRALLDAGEISSTDYDNARREVLETTTGTVTSEE